MADYDKLVESFFAKAENVLSTEDLQTVLEQKMLLEKNFGYDSLKRYFDQWVQRIESGQPFKLHNAEGEFKIDKSILDDFKKTKPENRVDLLNSWNLF